MTFDRAKDIYFFLTIDSKGSAAERRIHDSEATRYVLVCSPQLLQIAFENVKFDKYLNRMFYLVIKHNLNK